MESDTRASSSTALSRSEHIRLLSFQAPAMRAFHMAWFGFFLAFLGWFAIAPLMSLVRKDLGLTPEQVADTVVASVAGTVFARLAVGWLCDRIGPRRLFAVLLVLGALPVMGLGLAQGYESLLVLRLLVGMVGASFVVAQQHTSLMFAPRCVGTANAITAGWGNLGGGVTQVLMPALVSALLVLGVTQSASWRLALIVPGVLMAGTGVLYYRLTRDTPNGDLRELRGSAACPSRPEGAFSAALRDYRVWLLFLAYAACFGIELTTYNMTALYFTDEFGLGLTAAGVVAGLHGSLNLFARALGGVVGDRAGRRYGIRGRWLALATILLLEGGALVLFAEMRALAPAILALLVFSLFVQMACGATFAVVPFVNPRALGAVSGIVGAGGNVGAVAAGLLFRTGAPTATILLLLGVLVVLSGVLVLLARLREEAPAVAPELAGSAPDSALEGMRPAG